MSRDVISLTGLEVFAYHGVLAEEQAEGQTFYIDVHLTLDLSEAKASDGLTATVDYGVLADAIHERVANERWDLIERVADRVLDLVMEDERIDEAVVTIHKPDAPIQVPFTDVSVTVSRTRG